MSSMVEWPRPKRKSFPPPSPSGEGLGVGAVAGHHAAMVSSDLPKARPHPNPSPEGEGLLCWIDGLRVCMGAPGAMPLNHAAPVGGRSS